MLKRYVFTINQLITYYERVSYLLKNSYCRIYLQPSYHFNKFDNLNNLNFMLFLGIGALMEDSELRVDQEQNAERCAYKCALEMMMNIHVTFKNYF